MAYTYEALIAAVPDTQLTGGVVLGKFGGRMRELAHFSLEDGQFIVSPEGVALIDADRETVALKPKRGKKSGLVEQAIQNFNEVEDSL